jgi:type VI secretion system secreted protein Hcp
MKTRAIIVAVVALSVVSLVVASAAPALYVTVEGTKQGLMAKENGTQDTFGRFEGLGFEYEVQAVRDPASGEPTRKRQHSVVTVTKEWGASSPQLLEALVGDELLKSVMLQFVQLAPGGNMVAYATIKLTGAYVVGVRNVVAAPQAGVPADPRLLQEVSFAFDKIEFTHLNGGVRAEDDGCLGGGAAPPPAGGQGTRSGTGLNVIRDRVLPKPNGPGQ